MIPERFRAFADAYIVALEAAVRELQPFLAGQRVGDFTVETALMTLGLIERYGVEVVAHYGLNIVAFPLTAAALQVENDTRRLQDFLDGR
ncbi:MAG: hypothetical protein ACYDBH_00640 [Acidobacteriaceae bacterium]